MLTLRLLRANFSRANLQMIIEDRRVLEHKKYQMINQIQFSELNKKYPSKYLEKNEVGPSLLRSKPAY